MEKDIELIENYLSGSLSEQDKATVEERLKGDTAFARRFKIVKDSYVALDPEIQALEEDLKSIYLEHQQESTPISWRLSYSIAASLLVLSMAFLGYFMWVQNPGPESLYLSYLEIPANNIVTRGELGDNALKRGMEAYEEQDYQTALDQLQEVLKENPGHEGALFYSGICELLLDHDQNALVLLKAFEGMTSSEYYTAAQWYLGLAYLKMNDPQTASEILTRLQQQGNGKYAAQARDLLKEL